MVPLGDEMPKNTKHGWTKFLLGSGLSALIIFGVASIPAAAKQTDNVKQVQQTLRDKGYYSGPVDGVMGSQTRRSLGQYQKAEGFPVTNRLDARTAENLGVHEQSSWRTETAGYRFKTAGQGFGRGGAGFGKGLAKGRPIDAGRDLGEGFGSGGKNIGLGVAKVFTR